MKRTHTTNCSIAKTLEIIGDQRCWLILRSSFFGVRRFEDFQRTTRLARNILTGRLQHLVAEGVLRRDQYSTRPSRFEYHLTHMGLDLYGSALLKLSWGDRWLAGRDGPPVKLIHAKCGSSLNPKLACDKCNEAVKLHLVRFSPGPGQRVTVRSLTGKGYRRPSSSDLFDTGFIDSVARTLKSVGDRWSWLILREVMYGVHRFDELTEQLGIARNILADRLANLVASGILVRNLYQTAPDRFEYMFTEKGAELQEPLLAMMVWGDRWLNKKSGPPMLLHHISCGRRMHPIVVCSSCGEKAEPWDVTFTLRTALRRLLPNDVLLSLQRQQAMTIQQRAK